MSKNVNIYRGVQIVVVYLLVRTDQDNKHLSVLFGEEGEIEETWYESENVHKYERPLVRNLGIVERWRKAANIYKQQYMFVLIPK